MSEEAKAAGDNTAAGVKDKGIEETCKSLNLEHYFSRVRTPEDNPAIERYNKTLEEEFLQWVII